MAVSLVTEVQKKRGVYCVRLQDSFLPVWVVLESVEEKLDLSGFGIWI